MLPHVVESFFRTRHINLEVPQTNVLMLKKKGQWKSNDRDLVVGCEIVLCTVFLFSSQLFFSQMFWDYRGAQMILFFAIPSCRLRWTPYFLAAFQKAVNNLHDLIIWFRIATKSDMGCCLERLLRICCVQNNPMQICLFCVLSTIFPHVVEMRPSQIRLSTSQFDLHSWHRFLVHFGHM